MKSRIITIISIIFFLLVLIILLLFYKTQNISFESGEVESQMDILKVTSQNFEDEVLNSDKTVLIDFYADWCGPCKMLSPIIERIAEENNNIKVVKINIDDDQDLAVKYQVMSIPTVVVIKDGIEVNRSIGLVDKSTILDMIR